MNIKDIVSEYEYKTELHAHTSPASPCGDLTPEEVVRTYKEIGCHSVVITNHICPSLGGVGIDAFCKTYLYDYEKACEAGKQYGVDVILGLELRFDENNNDYLIYGVTPEDVRTAFESFSLGLEGFRRKFRKDSNIIIQAHPFRKMSEPAPFSLVDGIEAFNLHPGHNSRVAMAAKVAKENDLIVTGGTDFHHPGHQGMCLIRTRERLHNSFDVVKLLNSRDYLFDISGSIVFPYADR